MPKKIRAVRAFGLPERSCCYKLKDEDPLAAKLCELMQERGLTEEEIDTGLRGRLFRTPKDSYLPDGRIEPAEVYAAAIDVMESEIYRSGSMTREQEEESFIYAAWELSFRVPWLIYDGNPYSSIDADMWKEISALAQSVRGETDLEIARGIYGLVSSSSGLGIDVQPALQAEYDAADAISRRRADCTESSWILYSLYRAAGFDPRFVWVREDFYGASILHMAVAIAADGSDVTADTLFEFDADHRDVEDLPLLSALATYEDNVATQEPDAGSAARMFERSLRYDPSFPLTYLYLGLDVFKGLSSLSREECIKKAAGLDPAARSYMDLILSPED